MARKEKLTLDYFPHYAVQGDIPKIIQEKYGNDGYAVLYKNYEQFCLRDRQYIDLSEYVTLAAISAYCKITEEKYLEIVDVLVNLGTYDKELWQERKILISEKFIENTKDAYRNRTSEATNFEDIKNNLRKKSTSKCISYVRNQQIKLKESKEKEINLSLINGDRPKRIGKREREFLKSYCERNRVHNANAYIRKVLDNGDWYELVEEEKQYQCKAKEIEQKQEENKKKIKLLKAERLGIVPAADYNPERAKVIFESVRKNLGSA